MSGSADAVDPLPEVRSRLEDLYARHAGRARGLAYLLTGSPEAGEDLVHEAFVRLAGRFRHLRQPEAFGAYLLKTVVNLHVSRLRRLRVERAYLERARHLQPAQGAVPDLDTRDELWSALQRLPPRQRAAVVLRYYEDLSERETAEYLRCSVGAVKALVTRGLAGLRAQLEER